MKKTALSLACIASILLFTTAPVHAAEKKTLFNTESIKHESGTGAEWCQDKCSRKSGTDVKSLLSEGWKIVGSTSKEVIGEQYWYVPCNTCSPHGCICIGTEYILEKDGPAQQIEAKSTVVAAPGKDTRAILHPPQGEPALPELDLLTKENDLLKQENAVLKQENEALRNQLRSIQK